MTLSRGVAAALRRVRTGLHETVSRGGSFVDGVRYRYPHRVLMVAALPKSGSQWLKRMMLEVPGYRLAPLFDPRGLLAEHHIDEQVLRSIPRYGYYTVNHPVEATSEALSAIEALDLPVVILVRDLRDQAVSRYYHVLSHPLHPRHAEYNALERAAGISDSVSVVLDVYTRWVQDWLAARRGDPGRFHLVRYEDLLGDTAATFGGVLDFFGIRLPGRRVERIVAAADARMRSGGDLAERLKRGSTFRAGRVGDWRTHFSAADVAEFKRRGNELLVTLGYERDDAWRA